MSPVPENPKIYHITHLRNLATIVDGVLWSDAERIRRTMDCTVVGMNEIKQRRLEELELTCHPGTMVGDYVPFYFCPRSVMLYLLHKGNAPGLTYNGGQQPIAHLQSDLNSVLEWAEAEGRRWAFTNMNAGTRYAPFFNDRADLTKLNWDAIGENSWRDPDVKEGKQAEFLIETSFPWELVELVGVINAEIAQRVADVIRQANHRPELVVVRNWYY